MNNSQPFSLLAVDGQLYVSGALDFAAAARIPALLGDCIAKLPESFTVDLSGLSAFNSAVLAFMLDCLRLTAAHNKHCQFAGATPELRNLLEMAALEDLLGGA